jgi:ADP-L-glycero-D-manno-heptose 6-epimerase
MKILVTGWNGINKSFIPKAVAEHLKSLGHEVDGWEYDEFWEEQDVFYGWTWDDNLKRMVNTVPGNLRKEPRPFNSYDLIIHLGGISSTEERDVEKVMKQNFDFSLHLLNYCQKYKIPLHYASSASVYGQTQHFQENGSCSPQSPYAWSKYMFDRIVQKYGHTFTSPVIGFRYFNVYGFVGEKHKGNQASVMYKWSNPGNAGAGGAYMTLFEKSNEYCRDFIHVKDVCEIHEKMLEVDYTGIVNVGTGEAISFLDIANKYAEYLHGTIEFIPMPENIKPQYQKYTCADITKLK